MIRFSITDLLSEQECHDFLLKILHPEGLRCKNGHPLANGQQPHMSDRAPVVDYRCQTCGAVFNLFTGKVWAGTLRFSRRSRPRPSHMPRSIRTSRRRIIVWRIPAGGMGRFATRNESTPGTTMGTASAKCTATPWREFGQGYATSYACSAASTRNTSPNTSPCSSGHITSSE